MCVRDQLMCIYHAYRFGLFSIVVSSSAMSLRISQCSEIYWSRQNNSDAISAITSHFLVVYKLNLRNNSELRLLFIYFDSHPPNAFIDCFFSQQYRSPIYILYCPSYHISIVRPSPPLSLIPFHYTRIILGWYNNWIS